MQVVRVSGVLEADEEGFFAHCPELPGCATQGATEEEAWANLQEAIELMLEVMQEAGEPLPVAGRTTSRIIEVRL